ncbi:hypothetical protein BOTBODRAFT_53832 [Botryobasidium botryosum FD-172 SS1]|uniref:DNA replication factor Cdt1 C-terminal domain-containing protein n=1 Tax=Botryobasidium botryosum (strain FD-172 SS1) TaxID=930990 RepID=A0A067MPW5_BOTB1|nr:hypothetical protein BOTBODRAFT_53832 [Botryobasidium botryosum FD-172 SS1]
MEFYTPSKRRRSPMSDDEVLTPKRLRMSPRKAVSTETSASLPPHVANLLSLHNAIEQALSLGLASTNVGVAPSPKKLRYGETSCSHPEEEKGRLLAVINHIGMESFGLAHKCSVTELARLVWLWEWDGVSLPASPTAKDRAKAEVDDAEGESGSEDGEFFSSPKLSPARDRNWVRGGLSFLVTPTTHFQRDVGKRVPAYGIGVEVDMRDGQSGMTAIAQWTAGGEERRKEVGRKLMEWTKLHTRKMKRGQSSRSAPTSTVPQIPLATLPKLSTIPIAHTPSRARSILSTPRKAAPFNTPSKSKFSHDIGRTPTRSNPYSIFPMTPSSVSSTGSPAVFSTPSKPLAPPVFLPSTPMTPSTMSTPQTPSSSRRSALYERMRARELATPTKGSMEVRTGVNSSGEEQTKMVGPDELRRRTLLGRLGGVAEAVFMLFSASSFLPSSNPTPATRRRRTVPRAEVIGVVIKSSRTPISEAEASESLTLLTTLCPEFVRNVTIDREAWLEMPSAVSASPSKRRDPEEEVRSRRAGPASARKIVPAAPSGMGLREVRERIRKELEA